ncbi:MAG TPA: helix-turn-helix transcriptional regulator [Marmoricola sp.]
MAQEAVLFREALGEVLRAERMRRGLTLRELSGRARISLGYISEVERGQKEASSELLASLCEALEVGLGTVLRVVSDNIAEAEQMAAPAPAPITLPVGANSDVVASAA